MSTWARLALGLSFILRGQGAEWPELASGRGAWTCSSRHRVPCPWLLLRVGSLTSYRSFLVQGLKFSSLLLVSGPLHEPAGLAPTPGKASLEGGVWTCSPWASFSVFQAGPGAGPVLGGRALLFSTPRAEDGSFISALWGVLEGPRAEERGQDGPKELFGD